MNDHKHFTKLVDVRIIYGNFTYVFRCRDDECRGMFFTTFKWFWKGE